MKIWLYIASKINVLTSGCYVTSQKGFFFLHLRFLFVIQYIFIGLFLLINNLVYIACLDWSFNLECDEYHVI